MSLLLIVCACKNCETIVQGEAATKGIEKGKAGFGLLANVLIQKYDSYKRRNELKPCPWPYKGYVHRQILRDVI